MDNLLSQARKVSRDPRDCRKTMDTLRGMRFGEDAVKRLHHQKRSMAEFYTYTEGKERFREDGNNHRVHQRLMYVLKSCPNGVPPNGKRFLTLAEQAVRLIPPIQ